MLVISLGAKLGLGEVDLGRNSRIVVARDRTGEHSCGLLGFPVWPVSRRLDLPVPSKPVTTLHVEEKYCRGAVEVDGETLIFPDIGRIIGEVLEIASGARESYNGAAT